MKNILVLIDNSVNSEHLALSAMNIALTLSANVTLAHACKKDNSDDTQALEGYLTDSSKEQMSGIAEQLKVIAFTFKKADFLPTVSCMVHPGTVIDLLTETTNENVVDLVMIGSHQSGKWETVLFRSRMADIIDTIGCPLLVIPKKYIVDKISHSIFAVDLSIDYQKALRYFVAFSACFGTKVIVNNICTLGFPEKQSELDLTELVNSGLDRTLPPVTYRTIRSSHVGSALRDAIESTEVDLLCLVHKNYGFIRRMFHVSISSQLADNMLIPIMILPSDFSMPFQ